MDTLTTAPIWGTTEGRMTMATERADLHAAIDRCIRELTALKSSIGPVSGLTISGQAASAEAYIAHARKVLEITGDLNAEFVTVAASLGNVTVSGADRKEIRENDHAEYLLVDAESWIAEVREEEFA